MFIPLDYSSRQLRKILTGTARGKSLNSSLAKYTKSFIFPTLLL